MWYGIDLHHLHALETTKWHTNLLGKTLIELIMKVWDQMNK